MKTLLVLIFYDSENFPYKASNLNNRKSFNNKFDQFEDGGIQFNCSLSEHIKMSSKDKFKQFI